MGSTDSVKVVVLGNSSVGKSSLLARFAFDVFDDHELNGGRRGTSVTMSGAFLTKTVMVGTDKVKLHLWDTAGSEAYRSITRMYYRNAQIAILCYDITNYVTFTELHFWTQELTNNEPGCKLYICGCKLDLQKDRRQVQFNEAKQYAQDKSAVLFETSARTGENVVPLFNRICCDAVNWNFVSITTGQPYHLEPGVGIRKSFALTSSPEDKTADEGRGVKGCYSDKCSIF